MVTEFINPILSGGSGSGIEPSFFRTMNSKITDIFWDYNWSSIGKIEIDYMLVSGTSDIIFINRGTNKYIGIYNNKWEAPVSPNCRIENKNIVPGKRQKVVISSLNAADYGNPIVVWGHATNTALIYYYNIKFWDKYGTLIGDYVPATDHRNRTTFLNKVTNFYLYANYAISSPSLNYNDTQTLVNQESITAGISANSWNGITVVNSAGMYDGTTPIYKSFESNTYPYIKTNDDYSGWIGVIAEYEWIPTIISWNQQIQGSTNGNLPDKIAFDLTYDGINWVEASGYRYHSNYQGLGEACINVKKPCRGIRLRWPSTWGKTAYKAVNIKNLSFIGIKTTNIKRYALVNRNTPYMSSLIHSWTNKYDATEYSIGEYKSVHVTVGTWTDKWSNWEIEFITGTGDVQKIFTEQGQVYGTNFLTIQTFIINSITPDAKFKIKSTAGKDSWFGNVVGVR